LELFFIDQSLSTQVAY